MFSLAEGHGTMMRLSIEAGAHVVMESFFNGSDRDHTTEFIADSGGVSKIEVERTIFIHGGRLEVDLEAYDLTHGTDLVLFTYANYSDTHNTGFAEVQLSEGWSGTVD